MLTIHSVRVAVRGGVVNSEAIAKSPHAGLAHPATSPRRLLPTSPSCRSCFSGRRLNGLPVRPNEAVRALS